MDGAHLAAVLEAGAIGTFDRNVQTGALSVNERTAAIMGYTVEELGPLSHHSWLDVMHPNDRLGFKEAWDKYFAGDTDFCECESRLRHREGGWVWVMTRGRVMTRTPNGEPEWLMGVVKDITERKQREELIRKSQAVLDRMGQIAGIGAWELDLATNELFWSKQTRKIHGVCADFQPSLEAGIASYPPELQATIAEMVARAVRDGTPWDLELPLRRADGSETWVRSVGVAEMEDGKPVRLTGAVQDITSAKLIAAERVEREREKLAAAAELERMASQAREAAERASLVQVEKDRFSAAVNAVQGVLWTNDAAGRMTGEQPGWAALTGQRTREYQGYGWTKAVHPDEVKPTLDAWNEAVAAQRTFEFEHRVRRYDGCWRTFAIRAVPLFNPQDGSLREWVGVHTDITEHRQAEIALQESNAELDRTADEFRTLAEGMADLCWIARSDGHIYWYNRRWYDYTGKSPAAMEGGGWQSVHDPDALPPVLERWHASIATGAAFEMILPLRGADGVFRPFLTRVAPVYGPDGQVRRWLGTNVDVSELKETNAELEERVRVRTAELERLARHLAKARDEAERASQAKTRFLAGMSHELRTPLNGILGYAEMLRLDGGLNAVQQARLEAMLGAGNHLLEMITSVLDMSAIEAEHLALRVSDVDVYEVMERCLDVIGAAAEAKGLSLSLTTRRGTLRQLKTDQTRLRQVVLNLLGNAVKFTAQGSVELRLCPPIDGGGLRVEVADTGPGIPVDVRARLFQDFERLGTRATAASEGSGLGLALSARLTTLLGGRIGHDDRPGGGSVFWLELPGSIPGEPAELATAAADPAPQDATGPLRVLVADDVAMNRDIVQRFLASANHQVTCVDDGAAAVAAATNSDFDVVLMDVRMPEVDGLEATRQIRRLPGKRGRVPIIGLTAQAFAEQVAECTKAGMDAHVPKPFSPDTLFQAIARVVAEDHVPAISESPAGLAITGGGPGSPIMDEEQLAKIAGLLSPDELNITLRDIAERAQSLLGRMGEWQARNEFGQRVRLRGAPAGGNGGDVRLHPAGGGGPAVRIRARQRRSRCGRPGREPPLRDRGHGGAYRPAGLI